MRNIWRSSNDPKRCDNVRAAARRAAPQPRAPVIRRPLSANPLMVLARRTPSNKQHQIQCRNAYLQTEVQTENGDECVDMCRVQGLWQTYLKSIRALCHEDFWRVFLSMHKSSATQQDATLKAVKPLFVTNTCDKKLFPSSRRALMQKIDTLPDFWGNVLHTTRIDLRSFDLPSGTTSVVFKFINPL